MILLKDGVKYFLHEYASEGELAQMVVEHYKDIFGMNTLYFDPQTMKTQIGIEARTDGLILSLADNNWHIFEVELAKHSLHKHVIPQITKFNMAYQRPETRKKIAENLYRTIRQDSQKTAIVKTMKIEDLFKTLTEIIETKPTITIVIDQKTPEIEPLCQSLPFPTQTIEFATYTRENVGLGVHIHQFEQISRIKVPRLEVPQGLIQALEVAKLIYQGTPYTQAFQTVAKQHKIVEAAVRAKCTRKLDLNTSQFLKIVKDKKRLAAILMQRYPNNEDLIKETLA